MSVQEYDPTVGWHNLGATETTKPKSKKPAYAEYDGFDSNEIAAILLATQPIYAPTTDEVAESLQQQIAANGGTWPFIEFIDLHTEEQYNSVLTKGKWGDYYIIHNKYGAVVATIGDNVREKTVNAKGLKRITVHAPARVEIRETAVQGQTEAVVVKVTPYIAHVIDDRIAPRWNAMRSSGDDGLL